MQNNVEVSPKLKKAFKVYVAKKDVKIKDVVSQELEEMLENNIRIIQTKKSDDYTQMNIVTDDVLSDRVRNLAEYRECCIRDVFATAMIRLLIKDDMTLDIEELL